MIIFQEILIKMYKKCMNIVKLIIVVVKSNADNIITEKMWIIFFSHVSSSHSTKQSIECFTNNAWMKINVIFN